MPWSGYPSTSVTQLTYEREWVFSLKARREVQIGYTIRVDDAWELFGNGHWVWFTGAAAGGEGAVQIVSQWAEVQPMGPWHRVWQWIHWRNPSDADVIVRPYLLLAPPVEYGYLAQAEQTTVRKRIWTVSDMVSTEVVAFGDLAAPDEDAGAGKRGLHPAVALRPLAGQSLRDVELTGDCRYLPVHELSKRIDQLLQSTNFAAQQLP
jgi:hypothetical protein